MAKVGRTEASQGGPNVSPVSPHPFLADKHDLPLEKKVFNCICIVAGNVDQRSQSMAGPSGLPGLMPGCRGQSRPCPSAPPIPVSSATETFHPRRIRSSPEMGRLQSVLHDTCRGVSRPQKPDARLPFAGPHPHTLSHRPGLAGSVATDNDACWPSNAASNLRGARGHLPEVAPSPRHLGVTY